MAILNVKLPTNLTEYPNSFKRQGSFPLEAYSVFYAIHGEDGAVVTSALDAAKDYARNNPISYVGQILAVVDVDAEGASSVKVYKIENAAGDLIPVGDTAAADAAVEALQEKLDAVETAYKARCAAIEADVEALEAADEAFEQALANIYTKDEIDGFLDAIEESLDNVYTKSEIDGKVTTLTQAVESEATRAAAAEKVLQDAIDEMYTNAEIDKAIKDEADRAKGVEADLISDIADLELEVAKKANAEDVYTKTEVETYIKAELGSAGHLKREIVAALPEGEDIDVDTIYMVAKEGAEGSDVYVEYMWIDYEWEVIGDTFVDLTPYAKTTEVEAAIETAIEAVEAEVAKKATTEALESAVTTINAEIATKADADEVDAAIEAIETEVAKKADSATVEAALELKANSADVDAAIESASNGAKTYTDAAVAVVAEEVAKKVDLTVYNETVQEITENITNITNIIGGSEGEGESLIARIGALETGKANIADTLAGYGITDAYTKDEITKLIADITGGESAADVLAELTSYKTSNDAAVKALQDEDAALTARIKALEDVGAQANVLEAINFNGQDIAIVDKKATFSYTYELPAAMADALGGVKSSDAENKIAVDTEGVMEVNSLNVNKLTQTEGDTLILNGGSANI